MQTEFWITVLLICLLQDIKPIADFNQIHQDADICHSLMLHVNIHALNVLFTCVPVIVAAGPGELGAEGEH